MVSILIPYLYEVHALFLPKKVKGGSTTWMETDAAIPAKISSSSYRNASIVTVADVERQYFLARSHLVLAQKAPAMLETLGTFFFL